MGGRVQRGSRATWSSRPSFRALELVFFFFLAVLSVSFIGSAIWVGFDPAEVARGLVRCEMPGRTAPTIPAHVALAMIGAVGGSLMNLVYPYFLDAKGWRGPQYRRVQLYDFMLGIVAMLVLNLSIWVLGAELLYPDRHIENLEDLPNLLSTVLGETGTHAVLRRASSRRSTRRSSATPPGSAGSAPTRGCAGTPARARSRSDYRHHPCYPLDRGLVSRHAAGLDAAWHAWVRRADARRQQRAGRCCCRCWPEACGGSPRASG